MVVSSNWPGPGAASPRPLRARPRLYLEPYDTDCQIKSKLLHFLPAFPYNAVLTVERRVSHEGMVSIGGNLYSVPDATRKRVVEVQTHPREIRIFEDRVLIAVHLVLDGKGLKRVDPTHRKPVSRHRIDTAWPAPEPRDVSRRPLGFYEAVGRRLASTEVTR